MSGWQNGGIIMLSMDVLMIEKMSEDILTKKNLVDQKNWEQIKIEWVASPL